MKNNEPVFSGGMTLIEVLMYSALLSLLMVSSLSLVYGIFIQDLHVTEGILNTYEE